MATIDVIIALGPNSEPFAELSVKLFKHLESKKHTIRYRGIIGGTKVKSEPKGVEVIDSVETQRGPGDVTHAAVLKCAMSHVEADYTLLCDADIAVLRPEWDDICARETVDDVAAIGFRIPDQRCKVFPCVRFIFFDSKKLLECQPDFAPKINFKGRARPIFGSPDEETTKLLKWTGGSMYLDTGWKMPAPFHAKGYRGIVMPFLHPKRHVIPPLNEAQRKRLHGRMLGHEEYLWEGKIFAGHKGQVRRGFNAGGLWESRMIAYAEENFGFKYKV